MGITLEEIKGMNLQVGDMIEIQNSKTKFVGYFVGLENDLLEYAHHKNEPEYIMGQFQETWVSYFSSMDNIRKLE